MKKINAHSLYVAALSAMITFCNYSIIGDERLITNFGKGEETTLEWRISDDGVMGGRSRGKFRITPDGRMIFEGRLSLENNGGFSSVRTDRLRLDLSQSEGIALRVRGDGRTYQMRLNTEARYRSWDVSFSADVQTEKDKWIDVQIPFTAFKAGFRGRSLNNVSFDPAAVRRLGILLGDKNPGTFRLEVDSIRAYSSPTTPNILKLIADDKRLSTLQAALEKGGLNATLATSKEITIFAPTDAAFAALPEGTLQTLLRESNREKLVSILTLHVLPRRTALPELLTLGSLKSIQGESLQVTFVDGQIRIGEASLIQADLRASNGSLYIIDSVLLPASKGPQPLLSTAKATGSFETLLTAIAASGLTESIRSDSPVTIFAPNDTAFSDLPEETLKTLLRPENRSQLKFLLGNHAVAGRVSAGDALNAKSLTTLSGTTLNVEVKNGLFLVNGVTITETDLNCSNGIIHTVPQVLFPPNDAAFSNINPAPVTFEKVTAREKIIEAISQGVPAYNSGDASSCAKIYETCLESIAASKQVSEKIKRDLVQTLTVAKAATSDEKAWIYRNALDLTLLRLNHLNTNLQ